MPAVKVPWKVRLSLPTIGHILLLLISIAVSFYCGCLVSDSYHSSKNEYEYNMYDIMMAFGDSNTQFASNPSTNGYVSQLANLYQRQMDVVNRGFSGFNASSARARAANVLPKTRAPGKSGTNSKLSWPDRDNTFPGTSRVLQLLILLFGTNDSAMPQYTQHNPLHQYIKDMVCIIAMLKDPDSDYYSPSTRILVVTPPTVGDLMVQARAASLNIAPEWYNNNTKTYAEAIINVAKEANLTYIDLFSEMETAVANNTSAGNAGKYGGYENYLIDGIHMNANGYDILFNLISGTINSTWPEMRPSQIDGPEAVRALKQHVFF